jgi:hypothetical protein
VNSAGDRNLCVRLVAVVLYWSVRVLPKQNLLSQVGIHCCKVDDAVKPVIIISFISLYNYHTKILKYVMCQL